MRILRVPVYVLFVLPVLFPFQTPLASQSHAVDEEIVRPLSEGVEYAFHYYGKPRWAVHTLRVDLSNPSTDIIVGKALDNLAGLERLHSIAHRYDSTRRYGAVLAAVNANFWRAGSNHPMGPTVSGGLIITGQKHRNWSSIALTESRKVLVDTFALLHTLNTRYGDITIDGYNTRRDSSSLVVYTPFYGNTVPFLDTTLIARASRDTVTDESEIENGVTATIDSLLAGNPETGTLKLQFHYLSNPLSNERMRCIVTTIDTGLVSIPEKGGVLSFGRGSFPLFFSLFVGDTFSISSYAVPRIPEPVVHMVSGTPRLVRDGKVSVEWEKEGLKKVSFITRPYARTGMGISRDGKSVIFVTVEPTSRKRKRKGISLPDLAGILVERGAYQAVNLDGGSSATMLVGDETVSSAGGNRSSRKISTALIAVETATAAKSGAHTKQ